MTDFSTELLIIDDLQVHLIRSSRRRTLSLEIDHDGLKARAPMRMREKTIRNFVLKKDAWIRRHLRQRRPKPAVLSLQSGAALPYLGSTRTLQLQSGRRGKVILQDEHIVVPVVQSHLPLQQSAGNKLKRWYKQQAYQLLAMKVPAMAREMQLHPPSDIKVRDYKRRWGSCDHKGALSFNWRIIMAPEEVIDYVTIHELAHLVEFNHSARFWSIVARQLPHWRIQQQWLANHGAGLYVI